MLKTGHKATTTGKTPVIVFKVENHTKFGRKRAKYNTKRRKEVKTVRHIRACLRCSLLKIKCNDDAICITCCNLILHTHERQVLSFSACIRTRLAEVGFFEAYIPRPAVRDSILAKAGDLVSTVILDFASKVTWDLKELTDDVVAWLYDPMDSDTSKVGILSSPGFLDLISSTLGDCEKSNFQRMIYAESLAYTQPNAVMKHYLSIPELRQIGAIAGHEFLKCLDNKLKSQSLADCSLVDIQALFLLVFGTILAISYTVPPLQDAKPSNERAGSTPRDLHQLTTRTYHLCQILAHYMVYLGSHLKLPIANNTEHFLLESAPVRWHKRGKFEWLNDEEAEIIFTGTKRKTDYLLNNGHQLRSEEGAVADQNYLSKKQTMHCTPRLFRNRKALDLSKREVAADKRRRSYCRFCACSLLTSDLCNYCFKMLSYPSKPTNATFFFLPSYRTATGFSDCPYAERNNAAGQGMCANEMTKEPKAEQNRQHNLEVKNLLV